MLRSRETHFNLSQRTRLMWLVFMAGENYQESEFKTSTLPMICPRKFYF